MKSWIMRVSQMLQLSALLMELCQARRTPPLGDASASKEAGEVPVYQLRMLSLGLAHLLQGAEVNVKQLEQQGEVVAGELDRGTNSLESIQKQSVQTGRSHKQVRKDLQILSATRDRLWRAVRDLQKEMEDLETEQRAIQQRMNRILQRVMSLTEPRTGGQTQVNTSSMKILINKQAQQLATLTSVVSAQDRMIDRHLQQIEHLEKQLSSGA